MQGWDTITIIS